MQIGDDPKRKFYYYLYKVRWPVVLLLACVTVFVELSEHLQEGLLLLDPEFIVEFLVYGLGFPFIFGITYTLLYRLQEERARSIYFTSRYESLSNQLKNARDREEIIQIMLQFIKSTAALKGMRFWFYDAASGYLELAAHWGLEEILWPRQSMVPISSLGPIVLKPPALNQAKLAKMDTHDPALSVHPFSSYYLLLYHSQALIGLVTLYVVPEQHFTADQQQLLLGASPILADALYEVKYKQTALMQLKSIEAEHLRITHDIHDMLGPDLAYLRHKLDALSKNDGEIDGSRVRRDLRRLRDISDQAYGMLRGTLDSLQVSQTTNLSTALLNYSREIENRADFKMHYTSEGMPIAVPGHIQKQIFLIFREVLNNVEKHADANHVEVQVLWGDKDLSIIVLDDGNGFEIDQHELPGHFGLKIINERTRLINGRLSVKSSVHVGTEVFLWFPLDSINAEQTSI